jgi:uncharacterized membrane protein
MKDASNITEFVDVDVPVSTAYNQWTQFEEFPRFMEGVETVHQLDDSTLEWKADIGGVRKEWTAEITEQTPDTRIAWKSTSGAPNAGVVTFHRLSDTCSRVTLQLDYEPEGVVENVGDMLGLVSRKAKGDLNRFKAFIESEGRPTGAFRGTIAAPQSSRG